MASSNCLAMNCVVSSACCSWRCKFCLMNIEVISEQICWATRASPNVTSTLKPGNPADCVPCMGFSGVTAIDCCSRSTNASIGKVPASFLYRPNFSTRCCNCVRLRICSFMLARRWLRSSVMTGLTYVSPTTGRSTRTIVCDVYFSGRTRLNRKPPITPAAAGRTSNQRRRRRIAQ